MKKLAIYSVLIGSLFLVIFSSLTLGAMHIPFNEVMSILGKSLGFHHADVDTAYQGVIYIIRLPRLLLGLLVGAALGRNTGHLSESTCRTRPDRYFCGCFTNGRYRDQL
jgi:iron complex transport system permease protein